MFPWAKRVGLIARVSLLEAGRQKTPRLIFFLAAACVLGARNLRDLDFSGHELKFISDLGLGAMSLLGSLFAVVAAVRLVLGELEARTAAIVLSKPLGRSEYIAGKLAGGVAMIAVFCAGTTVFLLAVLLERRAELAGAIRGVGGMTSDFEPAVVAMSGFLMFLKLSVLAAFTVLVASFSRSALTATIVSAGILAIGQFQYLLHSPAAGNHAWFGALAIACVRLLPDFRVFDVGALTNESGGADIGLMLRVALYACLHIAAAGSLAVVCFRHREF